MAEGGGEGGGRGSEGSIQELTLMLLVANSAITKLYQKPEK